ncbi:MAG: D-TA family PLP-dependent enzyme [Flavisolibacter sp.]|jgi:D-serine deaminase-like pyridoxal phosphate-dependent protein
MNTWYNIKNIAEIDSPALIIYPERVKRNIQLLKGMIDDVQRLRPHVKTHKSREASLLLMEAGINKFKCATIAEAEMLAQVQAKDVLLAYQPVGPKVQRFISLIQNYAYTNFSCLVDDIDIARSLSAQAVMNNVKVSVYIDLNISMNRTGINPGPDALELYKECSELEGITLMGLHVYDGHINDADFAERRERCEEDFIPVLLFKNALVKKGFAEPKIVIGGSPTFPMHAKRKSVECSPGTFIFWDAGYRQTLTEQFFFPAALVISRIISLPTKNTLCLDLGHKSIAAEKELSKRVYFLNAPGLKAISQSEEHLVMETAINHNYKVGDVLYGLPFHICPTCALYERAFIVEDEMIVGEWEIVARDRKINA